VLSASRRELVNALREGNIPHTIAWEPGISRKPGRAHRARIVEKAPTDSVAALVRLAVDLSTAPQPRLLHSTYRYSGPPWIDRLHSTSGVA
jgi:DNA-binding CsgD family transcriptional regulator